MADSNGTATFKPECPKPFLDMSQFGTTGGHIAGRVCSEILPGLSCCLPCPATDWIYPPSFTIWYRVSQGFSVVGMVICVFLLISWTVLPPERTRRHYLSIGLVIGILLEGLAFVIPLGTRPQECYNAITPNDMASNLSCAFSGSFIVLGGLVVTAWITMRALSMHLQVCWDVVPGIKFLYFSNILGWGVSGLFFTLTMALVGVSYRFSDTCHVNPHGAMGTFWAPLLAMAGLAALLQVATFLYCFKVYLSNLWNDDRQVPSNISAGLPSFSSSHRRAQATRAVYKRVKEVLWLQWRSVTIIIFLLVDIVFFSLVWIQLDSAINSAAQEKKPQMLEFLACILVHNSNDQRSQCFALGQAILVNEKICVAVLLLISLTGIQTGLLLIRSSLLREWRDLFREKFGRKQEFVSLDAKRYSMDPRSGTAGGGNGTYPLNRMGTPTNRVASANTADTYSTKEPGGSPYLAQHSLSNADRNYRQPRMSFSTPRPAPSPVPPTPPTGNRPTWDSSETHAPPGTSGSTQLHGSPSARQMRDQYDGGRV